MNLWRRTRKLYLLPVHIVVAIVLVASRSSADDWPQWRGPQRDGVWRESGIVEKFDGDRIQLKWTVPISSGYSAPTVADGRVYVTDRVVEPKQLERIHCIDWTNGETLWSNSYEADYKNISYTAGPRAAVTIDDGRAFALGAMGHLHCYQAATGKVLWDRDLNTEYRIRMPIWGIATAPIVHDKLIIVQIGGSKGACVVALDVSTGKEKWRALDDRTSYSAPIFINQAGRRVLVCWTGDHVVGLNPKNGNEFWKHAFPPTAEVINVPTPVVSGRRMFLTTFYDGSEMLDLAADQMSVQRVWRRQGKSERETEALHAMISTPVIQGDYVYGVDSYGELRCLDAKTGQRLWEDLTATPKGRWSTIHMVRNAERIIMFNERGELIIGRLSPERFTEISRAKLIDPTTDQLRRRGGVCWAHPAFAYRHVFVRSDRELVCANLAAD